MLRDLEKTGSNPMCEKPFLFSVDMWALDRPIILCVESVCYQSAAKEVRKLLGKYTDFSYIGQGRVASEEADICPRAKKSA